MVTLVNLGPRDMVLLLLLLVLSWKPEPAHAGRKTGLFTKDGTSFLFYFI